MKRWNLKLTNERVFLSPQEFLDACCDYFQWCEDTPLLEENIYQNKGAIIRADKKKARAFTKTGLAQFLSISVSKLDTMRNRGPEWTEAADLVEQAIYTQKFEHAAAGLMNATMIARDLGLAEKQELGGIKDAPPVAFNIAPIKAGTFIPPEEKVPETSEA